MIRFERILCPTDFTPESNEALRYAVTLSLAYGAKLFLYHRLKPEPLPPPVTTEQVRRAAHDAFARALASHAAAPPSHLEWEDILEESGDDAGACVVRVAAERAADLIVMSSQRPPLAALVGSTAEAVCREAPCPVLVTHEREREWVGGGGEIELRRVLVAHDFSAEADHALRYALSLAQEYQAELHLLHALPPPDMNGYDLAAGLDAAEDEHHDAARRLGELVPEEARLWCRVVPVVRWGFAHREVIAYARENQIDLVMVGAHGADFRLGALLGSTADRVLRRAPCPVFVARPLSHVSAEGSSVTTRNGSAASDDDAGTSVAESRSRDRGTKEA